MVFNVSCLSAECQDPLEEEKSRCCHFGEKNQGWFESNLVILDGTMEGHRYIQITCYHRRAVFKRNFVMVQDNVPPHVKRDVDVMDWLAMSPDMNSIEHVWDQSSIWNQVKLSAKRGEQLGREGWGHWWTCLVVYGLLEGDIYGTIYGNMSVTVWPIYAIWGLVIWLFNLLCEQCCWEMLIPHASLHG